MIFITLATSIYKQYPMSFFDLGDVAACLGGRFYGRKPAFDAKALSELKNVVVGAWRARSTIELLRKTDGDFVAILLHKQTKNTFIVNDIFGRLPLYYWQTPHRFILSR